MSKKKDTALLTKEQIRKFKEREQEAKNYFDFRKVAESVAKAGDKDWARELYKKAEDLAEESLDYQDLAESIANEDYLGDKEWAQEILHSRKYDDNSDEKNTNDSDINEEIDEWEISKVKFLDNNCENSEGVGTRCEIKPVNDYEKIIEYFNSVYSDYVFDSLFNYKVYDDVIVLWGTTYLVRFNGEELGIEDIYDLTEEELFNKLKENNVPEVLHELILYGDGQIAVGDIVEKILMKPGTKAELDITDQEYGNSKVDLKA